MQRRWFIRLCFIVPIVLCVLAWAWSTLHLAQVTYSRSASYTVTSCSLQWGEINVDRVDTQGRAGTDWSFFVDSRPFHIMHPDFVAPSGGSFLGFHYERRRLTPGPSYWFACVPLWFPILILSVLLIPVWRKTRPGPGSFPVEPSEPAQSPGDPAA